MHTRVKRRGLQGWVFVTLLAVVIITGAVLIYVIITLPTVVVVFPESKITPQIYAPSANVAILNEQANFSVVIQNSHSRSSNGFVVLFSSGKTYQNVSFVAKANSVAQVSVNQTLLTLGIWEIDAYLNRTLVGTYAFDVELNSDQANLKAGQYALSEQSLQIAYIALFISIVSATIAGLGYIRPRRG